MSSVPISFSDPVLAEQIAHLEEWPPRSAEFSDYSARMHPMLQRKLAERGVERLFSHQAKAFDSAMAGRDLVVSTGTNSGKTLCYSLPAIEFCLDEPAAHCLFLFPTKSLAQDQVKRLSVLNPSPNVRVAVYDGDTPKSLRGTIRKSAHIVLSNPDMLHVGILPSHEGWAKFFRSLRLVVIDEMHVYRGVFGSHVGCVLSRLLRLCDWYHCTPQIIACSATIGNPVELFRNLTGRTPDLIDADSSPTGKRTFVFWNPPEIGEGRRLSANKVTSEILVSLASAGQRTLAFSRSRNSAELVLRYARRRAQDLGALSPDSLESYRAGYTPKERRQIEKALFSGKLFGLSATNAMELGVDVGSLDAVIMNGYPGSGSSFWQQAGRAGRGAKDGIAIMVAHEDPLEQYIVRRPEVLLQAGKESISVNPRNPQILGRQLVCAAHERPIAPSELLRFGPSAIDVAESLDRSGELEFRAGHFFYPSVESPSLNVNIRGSGGRQIRILISGEEMGSMEYWRALSTAHTGAVYLHRGATFLVEELDLDKGMASVSAATVDYYTQAVVRSVLEASAEVRSVSLKEGRASLSGVTVTDLVQEFRRKSLDGDTVLDCETLNLPPITYDTIAVRIDLPSLDLSGDTEKQIAAIHGMEHGLLAVAPLIAGCDRGDLGSTWYSMFPDSFQPAIFVFDKTPGGVGLAERLYESIGGWIQGAQQLISSCECENGCPGCLLSPRCESGNEPLNKKSTLELLDRVRPRS